MSEATTEPTRPVAQHEAPARAPRTPEEGGSQSGTQIDESAIDAPQDDHSPTTENDVT